MNGENEAKKRPDYDSTSANNNVEQSLIQTEEEMVQAGTALRKPIKLKSIGIDAVMVFCRQLSALIDVGIPLLKCLQILHLRTSHPKLKTIIHHISQEIEQGIAFSEALGNYPKVFSSFFVNMTKVAEKGGSLDESLKVVADVMEKEDLMKRKVQEALFYPLVTLFIGLFVIVILLTFVIPQFSELYARQDIPLPQITQFLLAITDPNVVWVWVLLIIGVGVFIYAYGKSHGGKAFYDRNKLKVPIFGSLFMKMYVARFARNFGTLIHGGVPLLQALDVVKETSDNVVVSEAVEKASQHVEHGGRLEQPLREADIFPDVVVDMIAIGEEAGKLELMLFKITELYDEEIDRMINRLASSIQPVLIVFLGLLTAFIAAAMFMPYFRLAQFLGTGF